MARFSPVGLLVLRLMVAGFRLVHGFGVLFEEGGGGKLAQDFRQARIPAPDVLAWGGGLVEFIGGLLFVLGFGTRLLAFVLLLWMALLMLALHAASPGADVGPLALQIGIALALFFSGGGELSVDGFLGWTGELAD